MWKYLAALCVLLPLKAISQETESDSGPAEPKTGVSAILGKLDWGSSKAQIFDDAKARLEREWRGKVKKLDALGVDKLRKAKKRELKQIEGSYTHLIGRSSVLDTSMLAGELSRGLGDAIIEQSVKGQKRYYFLRDDRLWKVAVVFDSFSAKTFKSFTQLLQKSFGKKAKSGKPKSKHQTRVWQDKLTVAIAHDFLEFYSGYLVVFIQKGIGEEYQETVKKQERPSTAAAPSDAIGNLFDDDGDVDDGDGNVVDDLTGSKHEVNLNRARLFETQAVPTFEPEDDDSSDRKKKKTRKKKK
ncbi:MAG: hypothetical protein ACON3Z_09105 [Bradymonadia bacterium]